jgi:thymidylate synthase (FAD)
MQVTLINSPINPDQLCGTAAAVCTKSPSAIGALRGAMASGHESVAEHASFTFHIEGVSRVLLAQLTRHRIASFSVESQRYCGVRPIWVIPETIKAAGFEEAYLAQCTNAYNLFCTMISQGVPEEDARYIIPECAVCDLVFTANARALRHFFSLRMCNRAQWEIRSLADKMHEICVTCAPVLFKNSGCGCMTGKGCPEGKRSCGNPRTKE